MAASGAGVADGDQRWLVECLTATLDTARDVRTFAEESLGQASLLPGYGAALTKVTINKEIPFGLRQLAAVLLKQFIKQHWQEGEENFVPPVVSASEKAFRSSVRKFSITFCWELHFTTYFTSAFAPISPHSGAHCCYCETYAIKQHCRIEELTCCYNS